MKKIFINCFLLIAVAVAWSGCDDKTTYEGGVPSPYIFTFDLRKIHKDADVVLNTQNMAGANSVEGVVVSDHTAKNMPAGYLMVQNSRLASSGDSVRAIAIAAGAAAANYKVGDMVRVKLEGKTLTRRNGMLQVVDVSESDIMKLSSGNAIDPIRVTAGAILNDPRRYESAQVTIVKATFNPPLGSTDTYSGDKLINDSYGDLILRTDAGATFSNAKPNVYGNYTGVVVLTADAEGKLIPHLRMRSSADAKALVAPEPPPFIITGMMADPKTKNDAGVEIGSGDRNYEYIQFRALRSINFATEPHSVVTTNNAGSPGTPPQGWATGGARTYKINLTSGSVVKGDYFYVGGSNRTINGPGSTDISTSAKWIRSLNYNATSDIFTGTTRGNATSNLLANSGNASGIAIFKGTVVNSGSVPLDVIFIGTGGTIYSEGPPANGYRVTTNDFYDRFDPITDAPQEFFRAGSNNTAFIYPPAPQDHGYFHAFGGVYDTNLGKWTSARQQFMLLLEPTSTINHIQEVKLFDENMVFKRFITTEVK